MTDNSASEAAVVSTPLAAESPPRLRAASACVACNKKKIRCVYPEGSQRCSNCTRNHWTCAPRERKRKRRKIVLDTNSKEEIASNISEQTPVASILSAGRALWDSGYSGWEPRRSIIPEAHHPSGASESSGAGGSTVLNNKNTARISASSTTPQDVDGHTFYPNSTSGSAFARSQQQESRPYETNNAFIGRSEYIREVPQDDIRPRPQATSAGDTFTDEDIRILQLQHAFDLPPRAVREGLIDTFMKRCAPWMPIVERSWLMERYGNQPSILLLQSVFLAASRVSSAPAVASYASSNEFYRRAKALFWAGYEKNTITVITAVCILHWYNPEGPEHVSINTSGFWNRIGIGLAHQIGLHKDLHKGRDAPLRRRLWWTLNSRDSVIAASHGRPRAINPADCEVRPLCAEDFYGTSANGALFVAYVEVTSLLGDLTEGCCRKALTRQMRTNLENALYKWSRELPEQLQLFRRVTTAGGSPTSKLVLAPSNFEARQLHVPYFVILLILYRTTSPNSPPSSAAILASSFVAGIFEGFLASDEIRYLAPVFTFYLLAAGMELLSCYPYPHLWEKAQQDLRIVQASQKELAKRWPSAVSSMGAVQHMTDEISRVPRPTERPPPIPLSLDQQKSFTGFGTDLCRLGDVMLGSVLPDRMESSRLEDDQYSRTVSDMMTAGILAELKTPLDAAATLNEYLPLATVLDHTTQLAVGGEETKTSHPNEDLLYGQYGPYDGIGNWLLRDWDWNIGVPWQ
ncbi:hypothetical protein FQN57_003527 [Myotisia sp. PD_48]|nr:hypothetical protein FQN57_003527 [Myotisia sp. PD_48]